MTIESLLAFAKESLADDCVVKLEVSAEYMRKLFALSKGRGEPRLMLPFTLDPLLPPNTAVLRYKSGKGTMVYANGDLLEFPPLNLDERAKLVDTSL